MRKKRRKKFAESNAFQNCYPFGRSADPLFKRPEILDLRGFVKTVKKIRVDLLWVGRWCCIILASFGTPFWFLFDTLLLHFDVQSHPWRWPAKVSKTSLETNCKKYEARQANGSKMGPQHRKVGGIFDHLFEAFPASFFGCILNVFLDVFWIDLCIIFMVS